MKKKLIFLAAILLIFVALTACSERSETELSFESNGGTAILSVGGNECEIEPFPEKSGYIFEGWYENSDLSGYRVEFPYRFNSHVTLYAKYIDINKGNEEIIYEDEGDFFAATSYGGDSRDVVIPKERDGKPVLAVREGFFENFFAVERFYFYSLETIEETFYRCSRLESFGILGEGGSFSVKDGVLYSDDARVLVSHPPARTVDNAASREFILPDGVQTVLKNSLRNSVFLEKIDLGDDLVNLEENFSTLENLKEINCSGKAYISQNGKLYDSERKTLIAYPCASEEREFTLPDGVTEIKEGALENSDVEVLNLNNTVTDIGGLETLLNLKSITAPAENPTYVSHDGVLFDKSGTLIKYPSAKSGEEYVLPDFTEIIDYESFGNLANLRQITANKNLREIAQYAFTGSEETALEKVIFPAESELERLDGSAFAGCEDITLVLNVRRPPRTDPEKLCENVSEILVPANVMASYVISWRYASDRIMPSGDNLWEFEVKFNVGDGTKMENRTVATIDSEPVPEMDDYEFLGWYDNPELDGIRLAFPLAIYKDTTLYAKWGKIL